MAELISLEFTTTACNRPSILNQTYHSYTKNLKGIDFSKSTLYLNVDPAPHNVDIAKAEEVAKKYFGKVIVNYPSSSNFSAAAYWCFSQVEGKYFFHLEDDWILLKPINVHSLISKMNNNTLQCILNKKRSAVTVSETGEPCFVPSLISTEYWKKYLSGFNININPEYQMKMMFRNRSTGLSQYKSVYYNLSIEFSRDIGRDWLKKNNLARSYSPGKRWSPWINWRKRK